MSGNTVSFYSELSNEQFVLILFSRVQNTCIQLHEDRSKQLREQLVTEWESERDMLKEAHQHQMQEIRYRNSLTLCIHINLPLSRGIVALPLKIFYGCFKMQTKQNKK